MIFILSKNYYGSPASLNEMGAAWITMTTDTLLLLPGFDFPDIKGCIDPTEAGIKLDGAECELKFRLDELKDILITEHSLQPITSSRWERHRDEFIKKVKNISEQQREADLSETMEQTTSHAGSIDAVPDHIPLEVSFLAVCSAADNGQIIKISSLGTGTTISAAGKEFMKDTLATGVCALARSLRYINQLALGERHRT